MSTLTQQSDAQQDALYRKITWRLMPMIFLSYMVAIMDRVNVGFAKLQMSADIGLSATAFGFGAGIFFIAYCFLEIPSNIYLAKSGARVWISRIMISWGIVTILSMFIRTPTHFYIARALLGAAEAGFFPGMIYYISQWYPIKRRTSALAILAIAAPVGAIVVGPLSGWILASWSDIGGLAGWKWLFILQGIPAIIVGILFFLLMPSTPDKAKWLTSDEKAFIQNAIQTEEQHGYSVSNILQAFSSGKVWAAGLVLAVVYLGFYAVTFWIPSMVKAAGVAGFGNIGLLTSIPFIGAAIFALPIGKYVDKTGRHRSITFIGNVLGAAGLVICVLGQNQIISTIIGLTLACAAFIAVTPLILAAGGRQTTGTAAAAGYALINTLASIGSFLGPYLIGLGQDLTGSTNAPFLWVALGIVALSLLTWFFPKPKQVLVKGIV